MAKRLFQLLRGFTDSQPLTFRGAVAFLAGAIAIETLAFAESDLVASMLGAAVIFLVLLALIGTTALSIRLKRRLRASASIDPGQRISRLPLHAGIILEGAELLPFFSLTVERAFRHPDAESPTHLLRGGAEGENRRVLLDSVTFPHRGVWEIEAVRCTVGDGLGLTSRSWNLPLDESYEILPPTISIRPLPLVAASARSGDEIQAVRERSGDPFDIKAYDPSDGITRILWKTYARSRELVVRRPEPAMIPEGEMAIYLVAGRRDDHVAGALLSYIGQLRERNITVLFGTDGLSSISAEVRAGRAQQFCVSDDEIRAAITHSVWSEESGTGAGFTRFLDALENTQRYFSQIIVFGPVDTAWLPNVLHPASSRSIRIGVAVAPEEILSGTVLALSAEASGRESPRHLREVSIQVERNGGELFICENAELAYQSAA